MNTPSSAALPDYDRLASVFDRYLPLIAPVGLAVLDRLPALSEGVHVLDVACGTGEPGLTLARRSPSVQVLGVDAAVGMVEVARVNAARENLPNIRFEVMAAEALACADGSMDAVVSRFGLLMFGDVAASARELVRVLRVDGHFSLAACARPPGGSRAAHPPAPPLASARKPQARRPSTAETCWLPWLASAFISSGNIRSPRLLEGVWKVGFGGSLEDESSRLRHRSK